MEEISNREAENVVDFDTLDDQQILELSNEEISRIKLSPEQVRRLTKAFLTSKNLDWAGKTSEEAQSSRGDVLPRAWKGGQKKPQNQ